MNSLQRTLDFIAGKPVDRPPFHPIIMSWAARYGEVNYRDFCLDAKAKANACIKCANDFDIDWVTVMSDPYVEAMGYGVEVEFPEDNLPLETGGLLEDMDAVRNLKRYDIYDNPRIVNTIKTIEEFKRQVGDEKFIVGWVEGPIAEYSDIRGLMNASMDFFDDVDAVKHALDVIVDVAMDMAEAQLKAGAHCIGIGDAFCSQIGPEFYREFAFEREKKIIDHIHSLGGLAKLHICGDTGPLLPDMVKTGADILDIDHLVGSMEPYVHLLAKNQVFSGNSDPVAVIQDGTPQAIQDHVTLCHKEANGRVIISAGCEVPIGTTLENFKAYENGVKSLSS